MKKESKWVIDRQKAEKLYKGGLIKEDTYKKICGYADGGIVETPPEEPAAEVPYYLTPNAPAAAAPPTQAVTAQEPPPVPAQKPQPTDDPGVALEAVPQNAPQTMNGQFNSAPYEMMNQSVMESMKAGEKEAAAQVGYAVEMEKSIQAAAESEKAMQMAQKEQLDSQMEKIDQAVSDLGMQKIDSTRLWNNASTGQKVALAIGVMLSGVNGSTTGVQLLNNSIDRDIEAQKSMINSGKEKVAMQRGLLADMMTRFGDERQALAATKLASIQAAELRLKQVMAQTSNVRAKADGMESLAKIGLLKEEARQKFIETSKMTGQFQNASDMAKKISMLPKEVQGEVWKELGELKNVESSISQVGTILRDVAKASSVASNLTSPIQSANERELAFARIFPLVKSIVGEKMSEGDAQNMVKPYLPKGTDSAATVEKKINSMVAALRAQIPGRAPRLSAFGLIPRQQFSEGAPK